MATAQPRQVAYAMPSAMPLAGGAAGTGAAAALAAPTGGAAQAAAMPATQAVKMPAATAAEATLGFTTGGRGGVLGAAAPPQTPCAQSPFVSYTKHACPITAPSSGGAQDVENFRENIEAGCECDAPWLVLWAGLATWERVLGAAGRVRCVAGRAAKPCPLSHRIRFPLCRFAASHRCDV